MDSKPRLLFIDRDGTLIEEPPDEQIDAIEKLRFLPGVFRHLASIAADTLFKLVMVSNQDGLGTPAHPRERFQPIHDLIMRTLEGEGIHFNAVHIDPHTPADNHPNRKPGTGMLTEYMTGNYDLEGSYVVGDRATDTQLARNLGCRALILRGRFSGEDNEPADGQRLRYFDSWADIDRFLHASERRATVVRNTKETQISVTLDLDNALPQATIDTGLGFFDHMLEQIARHGNIALDIHCHGDLNVDEHHLIEDTGLALGQALREALGDKRGIERYGFALPMDDCMALVCLDFGGRPELVWKAQFHREKIGEMPTEMFRHFFKSLSDTALMNLRIEADGENEHHKIEAIFKALARSLRQAVRRDVFDSRLPSTKGAL